MKTSKRITVTFTEEELWEVINHLANGTCDFDAPGNEVSKSANDKLNDAWLRNKDKG